MPVVTAVKRQKLPKVNRYEATVRACCKAVGIPAPEAEVVFCPPRKWRFDFGWKAAGYAPVALEVDGGVWVQGRHSRGSGLVKEHEKMNHAAALGWVVFRATPQTIGDLGLWRLIREAMV